MGTIGTALSMSLDGFIAGPGDGAAAAGLHDWLTAGQAWTWARAWWPMDAKPV